MRKLRSGKIKLIHRAPGKKGKLEVRFFDTLADANAYIERNEKPREHGRPGRLTRGHKT